MSMYGKKVVLNTQQLHCIELVAEVEQLAIALHETKV